MVVNNYTFKSFLNRKHLIENEMDGKINAAIDSHGFIFFFKKDGQLYGGGEDSRLVFAKMKNPDDDLPSGWDDEASFSGFNLETMLQGNASQHLFKKEDLKKIKVVDRSEVVKELRKEKIKKPEQNQLKIIHVEKEPENMIRTDEE